MFAGGDPRRVLAATGPPVWRRNNNPRFRQGRKLHYPEITDWGPYKRGEYPVPLVR